MSVNVVVWALPQPGRSISLFFFIIRRDSVLGFQQPFAQGQSRDAPSLLVLSIVPSGKQLAPVHRVTNRLLTWWSYLSSLSRKSIASLDTNLWFSEFTKLCQFFRGNRPRMSSY